MHVFVVTFKGIDPSNCSIPVMCVQLCREKTEHTSRLQVEFGNNFVFTAYINDSLSTNLYIGDRGSLSRYQYLGM